MKKSIYRLISAILGLILIFSMTVSASALAVKQPEEYHINTDGYHYWKVESKELVSSTYKGAYTTIGSIAISKQDAPQTITVKGTKEYSPTVSGTVKVAKKALEASVGFSYNTSNKVTVSITKKNASAGTYLAQSRGVYKRYKVKQQRYYKIDGYSIKEGNPVYCYVNVYRYEEHRLAKK